jgi:hypothetical protein
MLTGCSVKDDVVATMTLNSNECLSHILEIIGRIEIG